MKAETFQTLHPVPGKTNKSISKVKYERVKAALLSILESQELTHTDFMEALYQQIGADFEGAVPWYGEEVKLGKPVAFWSGGKESQNYMPG